MRINKSGFTIVELIVVIIVISILATITLVAYNGVQGRSRDDRRKTDIENIEKAMELYYSDNGTYPVPTGSTGSVINGGWYSSGDTSWTMLSNLLIGSQAIDTVPVDPINTANKSPFSTCNYGYAIYVNQSTYCGAGRGQMYLITYRFESNSQEKSSDGTCNTNPLGDGYYTSYGVSYFRSVKGGS